ncbi:ASPIC/UnbV domain-containing protein [Tunturiibacter lichenicola]
MFLVNVTDLPSKSTSYNSSSNLRLHFGLGAETHLANIQI